MDWTSTAMQTSTGLRRNGLFGIVVCLLVFALAPVTAGAHGFTRPLGWWLLLAFTLAALAFSVHLIFDALLFRLAGSHPDERTGLAAVDDSLARFGLRAAAAEPRPLAARLAGSRGIVWRQRFALAVCLLVYGILLIDAVEGPAAC